MQLKTATVILIVAVLGIEGVKLYRQYHFMLFYKAEIVVISAFAFSLSDLL